jgi:hypothetical protein
MSRTVIQRNPVCAPDIIQRARLIDLDFDRLDWLDGDLGTPETYRFIARHGRYINDHMALHALYRRRAN